MNQNEEIRVLYVQPGKRNISMIHKKMNMMRDKSICMENR